MCAGDVTSAAEETIAAIDGALATHDVPAALVAILRDLQKDLVSTLGDTAAPPHEAAVERIVALRHAVGVESQVRELNGTTAAGSWLRLARAFARRGVRALAADQPCVTGAYLREVADLLLRIATMAEERAEAEVAAFAHLTCDPASR